MNVIVIQCLFFVERRQNHRSRDIKEEKKDIEINVDEKIV